jgi:ATP-dependent exoDNAse (exonuclease V) alpha subunit
MLGNEAARDLLLAAREARARVVLVGDRDQLPSIEAGRAFALLGDHGLSIATIDTIVRQKDPDLRRAVVKTIAREHEEAIDILHARIVTVEDRRQRLQAISAEFLDLADRKRGLVITPSNADRRALNELIRRGLQERGLVGAREIDSQILVRRDLTKAEAKDAIHYVAGDVVRFGRAYKRLGIRAKSYLEVKAVDAANGIVTLEANGREIAWRPGRGSKIELYRIERRAIAPGDLVRWTRNDEANDRYNAGIAEVLSVDHEERIANVLVNGVAQTLDLDRERHWEHAYASTIHAAQGRTADRVLLHLDSSQVHLLGHEGWYVGISRARRDVRIFTDSAERLPAYISASLQQESALEVARQVAPPVHEQPRIGRKLGIDRAYPGFEIGR